MSRGCIFDHAKDHPWLRGCLFSALAATKLSESEGEGDSHLPSKEEWQKLLGLDLVNSDRLPNLRKVLRWGYAWPHRQGGFDFQAA